LAAVELLTTLDRDRIATLLDRDEFFWLDLESPQPDSIEDLGKTFKLHPLSIEDTLTFDQRPKLESYDTYAFVVFYGARTHGGGRPELVEVHVYISGSYVVTVHRVHCEELIDLRKSLQQRGVRSEEYVVYSLFDALTDSFFPVLADIDDQIDALEGALLDRPRKDDMHRIQGLRRELVSLRRRIAPQRDLFARQMDEIVSLPGFQADKRDYFRDIYDHLLRAAEEIDSFRDVLSGLMDVYLSSVSNRLNAVTERLTLIATIFLPLTFVTGFFGQTFAWLVHNINTRTDFLLFGIGGLLLPIVLLLVLFQRTGWLRE
jgi:magnesium transporter